MRQIIVFLSLLHASSSYSLEVDNFQARKVDLNDAEVAIETLIDSYIGYTVEQMNSVQQCDKKQFIYALHEYVGGWTSRIESDIDADASIDKFKPLTRSSIYGEFNAYEGKLMLLKRTLGSTVRIDDLYVGTDKLGHFLDTGFRYFEISSADDKGLDEAIAWGQFTEIGQYGLAVSGIYSYADLAANYEGWRFWMSFYDSDLAGIDSYVSCENGVWLQVRSFDLWEYIGPAWDEGQNCNTYGHESAAKKVETAITKLGYSCPINSGTCNDMLERYQGAALHAVSPSCGGNPIGG